MNHLWKSDLPSKDGEALSEFTQPETRIHAMNPLPKLPTGSEAQWFAAYTTPRHEKYVADLLTEFHIENFLPLYRTARQWKKRTAVVLELPLFPTYVFVRIPKQSRGAVLSVPGVISIVGSAREPWALPDHDIEDLRTAAKLGKVEPHSYLNVGEQVRIRAGVMKGREGVLVRRKNEFRVVLSLDTIMQSFALEIDAEDLEPVVPFPERRAC